MTTKHNLTFRSGKTRDRIVDYLAKHPGATTDKITEALSLDSLNNASTALYSLFNAGLVSRRRAGRCYAYMLKAEEAPKVKLVLPEDPDHPRQYTLLMPEVDINVAPLVIDERTALERRLAELEAFKAEALAKHPDLSPIDYEAYRPALAAFYRATGMLACSYGVAGDDPFDKTDMETIDGLIAAAKLFPEEASA
jgi:DNA-binding transcriptional ArsR family regulator